MRSEALKGHLDLLIASTIRAGATHGYAIIQSLRTRSGGRFDLPEGTVYPVLHRLEEAGILASHWSTETGRKRRVYQLTRRGQSWLETSSHEWHDFSLGVQAVISELS